MRRARSGQTRSSRRPRSSGPPIFTSSTPKVRVRILRVASKWRCRTITCRRCRSPGSRDVRRVGRMGDSVRMSWWGWQRPCSWRGRHRCVAGVREREGWHLRCLRRGGLGTDHRGRYRGARASVGEAVGIVFDHESDCNCTCGADAVESQRDIPQ